MIDVEIRGPVPKKKFDELKKLFMSAADSVREEKRIYLKYAPGTELRYENGAAKVVLERGTEIRTTLAEGEFSHALSMMNAFGYAKGFVRVRDVLACRYGGAEFLLVDPSEDDFYYEARITTKDPVSAKEAKAKLEALARNLKLPMWNDKEMFAFIRKLNETVNYQFDYESHGASHFKDKFGI